MKIGKGEALYYSEIDSPIGPLTLSASEQGLCAMEFGAYMDKGSYLHDWARRWRGTDAVERDDRRLAEAAEQVRSYFAGSRNRFDLKLDLRGTPFQLRVWQALLDIPYGETRSYGDVARAIGAAKAVRAVGGANNRNPLPIVVPCHRVIGASGDMVGYGGGLDIKRFLLRHEGIAN